MKNGRGGIGHRARLSVRDKHAWYNWIQKPKALIVRRRANTLRRDGSAIRFDDNAVVVISKNKPKGTKIKGPVAYEVQHNCRNLARWIF